MQHVALVTQNKMDSLLNKNTGCALQKYIKITGIVSKDNVDNYNRQLRQLHYVKKMDCSLPKLKTISVNCNVNSCQFEVNFCFWVIRMQHVALVTQNKI